MRDTLQIVSASSLAAAARRQRERDVLGDGQRLEQREMLEHHADAEPPRLGRAVMATGCACHRMLPASGASAP